MSLINKYTIPSKIKDYEERSFRIEIGYLVRDILNTTGKTQKQFAEKLNMKEAYLSKIMRGQVNLTLSTIFRLQKALQIDLIKCVPLGNVIIQYTRKQASQWQQDIDQYEKVEISIRRKTPSLYKRSKGTFGRKIESNYG